MTSHFTGDYHLEKVRITPWQAWPPRWPRVIYRFRTNPTSPLIYHGGQADTLSYKPHDTFETDLGSIPYLLRIIPYLGHDCYRKAYIMHDSACQFGGLWIAPYWGDAFGFLPMPRLVIDRLLRKMLIADGASERTAKTVYAGLRLHALWRAVTRRSDHRRHT